MNGQLMRIDPVSRTCLVGTVPPGHVSPTCFMKALSESTYTELTQPSLYWRVH